MREVVRSPHCQSSEVLVVSCLYFHRFSLAFVFDASDEESFLSRATASPRLLHPLPLPNVAGTDPTVFRRGGLLYTEEGGGVNSTCSSAAQIAGLMAQALLIAESYYGYLSSEVRGNVCVFFLAGQKEKKYISVSRFLLGHEDQVPSCPDSLVL